MATIERVVLRCVVLCIAVCAISAHALSLTGVQSRKTHLLGSGTYDLPIDNPQSISGPITVEPRVIGAGHSIVFQFDGTITSTGSLSVIDDANATVADATPAISGNEVVVTLTGIPDNKRLTVTLTNVNGVGLDVSASLGFLVGDVNGTRSVNSSDISAVKARSGQTTVEANFKFDLNATGAINAADISVVKARAGFTLSMANVAATVYDALGRFVAGAVLTAPGSTATTDAGGHASIQVATGTEQAVRITLNGFAEQVKVLKLDSGVTSERLDVTLIAREPVQAIAAIESGGSATGRDGVKVTFPPGALVDGNGQAVTGTVQMLMTPVNVADPVADVFPGLFEGIPESGPRTHIVSFGAAELVPRQNGQTLNLGPGRTAVIELPMYVDKQQDSTKIKAGDNVPLWSLNMATGVWIQEGAGTVVASSASPTGLALRATIGHFSWWNADIATASATVNLIIDVPGQTVPANTRATVGARIVGGSGPSFGVNTVVTVNLPQPVPLLVPAPSTTRFNARANLPGLVCTGTTDVAATIGAVIAVTLHLDSCATAPVPLITRPLDPTATNSQSPVVVDIALTGPQPDSVGLFVDGASIANFPAQFFYRAFWDTSTFFEGEHTLVATATLNSVATDSQAVTVVVDRTPPLLMTVTPAPGSTVRTTTVFTLRFTEPVNAAPFTLADAVKLSATPFGSSTPVAVPATVAFTSALQDTLTVVAQQPLPPGAGQPVLGRVARRRRQHRQRHSGGQLRVVDWGVAGRCAGECALDGAAASYRRHQWRKADRRLA